MLCIGCPDPIVTQYCALYIYCLCDCAANIAAWNCIALRIRFLTLRDIIVSEIGEPIASKLNWSAIKMESWQSGYCG